MDEDHPIAERDFPAEHSRNPTRDSTNSPNLPPAILTDGDAEGSVDPPVLLSETLDQLRSRTEFLKRREQFSKHMQSPIKPKRGRDMLAMSAMRIEQTSSTFNGLGECPGVIVGDEFRYFGEMLVHGLHRQTQGGIAWTEQNGTKLASSVVASGGYPDNDDSGERIKYSGQGGGLGKDNKGPVEDQKLILGNEALYNSFIQGTPVRVIRGYGAKASKEGGYKVYSYDGLYKVTNCEHVRGTEGFKVYIFTLDRLPNQLPLDMGKWRNRQNRLM